MLIQISTEGNWDLPQLFFKHWDAFKHPPVSKCWKMHPWRPKFQNFLAEVAYSQIILETSPMEGLLFVPHSILDFPNKVHFPIPRWWIQEPNPRWLEHKLNYSALPNPKDICTVQAIFFKTAPISLKINRKKWP